MPAIIALTTLKIFPLLFFAIRQDLLPFLFLALCLRIILEKFVQKFVLGFEDKLFHPLRLS